VENGLERSDESGIVTRRLASSDSRGRVDEKAHRQRVHGLPAIERIAVMVGEETQILITDIDCQAHWRREAAIDRRHRTLLDPGEDIGGGRLIEREKAALDRRSVSPLQWNVAPVRPDEPGDKRGHHRLLRGLAWRWRQRLRKIETVGLGARIVSAGGD